jgi:Raf kinase inhibitor-like YbhB/YbcL family protein
MRIIPMVSLRIPFPLLLAAGAFVGVTFPMSTLDAQAGGATLTVSSSAFKDGQPIPETYTAYGKGRSVPLTWSNVPSRTRSLAVVMDDPDAKGFVHWLIYNIPAETKSLDAGLPTKPRLDSPKGALQGSNSTKGTGYFGPRPPQGDPPHHYQIKVYALDEALKIDPGADEDKLLGAMKGHILGQGQVVGTVQKK